MLVFTKALLGSGIVIVIQLVSGSKYSFLAGLVPLFPSFAMISYYTVGSSHCVNTLKHTIVFGIFSLVPYFVYLISLYFLVGKFKLHWSLAGATLSWIVVASVLFVGWNAYNVSA